MAISDYTRIMLDASSKYKDMSIVRKARIVKTFAAWVILFRVFLEYLDVFSYIDLPTLPLLPEPIRCIVEVNIILPFIIYIGIIWLFDIIMFEVPSAICTELKYRSATIKKILFVKFVVDYFFSCYFLIYAVNYLVNYVNGIYDMDLLSVLISIVYIFAISLERDYYKYCDLLGKFDIRYTNYCDSKGMRIPEESRVFYEGKLYKIKRNDDGKWVLYDISKKLIQQYITLEEASADGRGNLMICQE